MTTQQGQDGTPHLTYYDRTHALSFVWDATNDGPDGHWIDVSFGGYAEPTIARIPWVIYLAGTDSNVLVDGLASFTDVCRRFIEQLHDIESVDRQASHTEVIDLRNRDAERSQA